MNKFNNKYVLILLIIGIFTICENANSIAENDSLIDPLNLNEKKPVERHNYQQTRAIITSIAGDKESKSITIKGMPYVTYKMSSSNNSIEITIPHSYLHKGISSASYNWDVKLKNQLPDILSASVNTDINKRDVIINVVFKYPITASASRMNSNSIVFKFLKSVNQNLLENIQNSTHINLNEIDTLNSNTIHNEINYKPSGKYVTVIPDSRNTLLNKGADSYEKIEPNKPQSNDYITIKSKTIPIATKKEPKTNYYEKTDYTKISSDKPTTKPKQEEVKKLANNPVNNSKYSLNNEPDLPSPPEVLEKPINSQPETSNENISRGPQPEEYTRTDNSYSSDPQTLPKLDRPEQINNDLLNSNDYDDLIRIAVSLESENKLEDSIQKYSQAITTDPGRYEAYAALGDVHLKLEDFTLAIQNYEKALEIKNDIVKTIFNLGVSYSKDNQSIKAISNFEKALAIQPENYEIKYNLASEFFILKDYQNAIKYYKECIKSSEKSKNFIEVAKVKYNLANTYKANNELNNAIQEFIDSIKIFPEFADAHYNLAAAYVEKSQNEKAIKEFEEYIKYTSLKSDIERVKELIKQLKNNH